MTAPSGENLELVCTFSTNPRGTIVSWDKDGQTIAGISNCSAHLITSCHLEINGEYAISGSLESAVSLHIFDITLGDTGNYECKVVSQHGFGRSAIEVQVTGRFLLYNLSEARSNYFTNIS